MPAQSRKIEYSNLISLVWLTVLTYGSFFILISGREFLFDDVTFVQYNPDIARIHTFWDCFQFVLQPSKPIFNFFMALAIWLGKGSVFGQRLMSVSLHVGSVLLVFLNLKLIDARIGERLPHHFALVVASLFAILPIHTEILAIAQFRGDLLAAFFSLSAIYLTLKIAADRARHGKNYLLVLGVVVCLGLAQFSKEVFAVSLPPLLLFFFLLGEGGRLNFNPSFSLRWFAGILFLTELGFGLLLFRQIIADQNAVYSYNNVVGAAVMTSVDHLRVAGRSLTEAVIKTLSGTGMTLLRLNLRSGVGENWPWALHLLVLMGAFGTGLLAWFRAGWWRVGSVLFIVALAPYLIIPNANMGSEHYTYLAALGLTILFIRVLSLIFSQASAKPAIWLATILVYGLILIGNLESREFDLYTRKALNVSDLRDHPENPAVWIQLGVDEMNGGAARAEVLKFASHALALYPNYPYALTLEGSVYQRDDDWDDFIEMLPQIFETNIENRRKAAVLFQFVELAAKRGYCDPVFQAIFAANQLDPTSGLAVKLEKQINGDIQAGKLVCRKYEGPSLVEIVNRTAKNYCPYRQTASLGN